MGEITFDLNEREYEAARRYADGLGLSVAEAARRAVIAKLSEWQKTKKKDEPQE